MSGRCAVGMRSELRGGCGSEASQLRTGENGELRMSIFHCRRGPAAGEPDPADEADIRQTSSSVSRRLSEVAKKDSPVRPAVVRKRCDERHRSRGLTLPYCSQSEVTSQQTKPWWRRIHALLIGGVVT